MALLSVLVFFVFFAGVAMTIGEGVWNNTINLMAIILAALTAAVAGPPLGVFALDKFGKEPPQMWYFTFAGTWLVFFLTVTVFRLILERTTRVRMKFVPPMEMAGGPLIGLLASLMFTSFLASTLYAMPIKSGEWDFLKAASWQQTTLRHGSSMFLTTLKATLGEEVANDFFMQK
jgi:hypothetical protein